MSVKEKNPSANPAIYQCLDDSFGNNLMKSKLKLVDNYRKHPHLNGLGVGTQKLLIIA